jgi:hypothetical protein
MQALNEVDDFNKVFHLLPLRPSTSKESSVWSLAYKENVTVAVGREKKFLKRIKEFTSVINFWIKENSVIKYSQRSASEEYRFACCYDIRDDVNGCTTIEEAFFLTSRNRVLLGKLTVGQITRNTPPLLETEGLRFQCAQESAVGISPESDTSSSHPFSYINVFSSIVWSQTHNLYIFPLGKCNRNFLNNNL